jgi:DNA-binding CsgD family transcriptional regulator
MGLGDASPQPRDIALTDREKATLRLLLVGHDAKSIARELGLSVHTVNERLRDARRKLGVASSREAARHLASLEAGDPQKLRDAALGVSTGPRSMAVPELPAVRPQRLHRLAWLTGGMLIMSLLIAAFAAATLHAPSAPVAQVPEPVALETAPASLDAAKRWLALIDQGKWQASWQTAAAMFRTQVTQGGWAAMVTPVRQPLGTVVSRKFESVVKTKTLPGAPAGDYEVLKFQTRFAERGSSTETVILVHEADGWRVAGYFIR